MNFGQGGLKYIWDSIYILLLEIIKKIIISEHCEKPVILSK